MTKFTHRKKIIWSISGSDCSGGAGITADIKVAHYFGLEICTLLTANTSQNSQGVTDVNPIAPSTLEKQVQLLIEDKPPAAIKIGLIASLEQLAWLKQTLPFIRQRIPNIQVILDPVGHASAGGSLSDISAEALVELLPYIDLITPNKHELFALTAKTNSAEEAINYLLNQGVATVCLTGGHGDEQHCIDQVYCAESTQSSTLAVKSERIKSTYTHGTGCTFATAITCLLAKGYLIRDALTLTKAYIQQGIMANEGQYDYYGAVEHTLLPLAKQNFPTIADSVAQKYSGIVSFPQLSNKALGLYPVVDSIDWLERLLPLGISIIQLRIKQRSIDEVSKLIKEAVALCRHYDTQLFINDYWQLAIEHKAYGVHLGQEDLLNADLNAIAKSGVRLGISTHGCYEFLLAQQIRPSYLAIGAIFPTTTKDMTGQIQGLDNLSQILTLKNDIPIVAIGGINLARAESVLKTGVDGIAVVTAITQANDYKQAVNQFSTIIPRRIEKQLESLDH